MKRIFSLIFVCTASAAVAETPMSASEFGAYVDGKTLYYSQNGQPYGAEQYLPNQRVRWSFLDGDCKEGVWYQQGQEICFVYEDFGGPQCWSFYLDGSGKLRGNFESDPEATTLYEAQEDSKPMLCLGPEVGV